MTQTLDTKLQGVEEMTHLKTVVAFVFGSVWRSWRTGCLTEKLTMMYSSFMTCHERSVTTSLFFIGFGQSPAERKKKCGSVRFHSLLQLFSLKLNKCTLVMTTNTGATKS